MSQGFGLQSKWLQETQEMMALRGVAEFFDQRSIEIQRPSSPGSNSVRDYILKPKLKHIG